MFKLKLEHLLVLEALEQANSHHGRVVSVVEIVQSLSDQDKKRLGKAYAQPLNPCIAKVLELLRARGLVFSLGDGQRRRFYGSTNVLDSSDSSVPRAQSRRRLVLGLVRETALALGRAVRNSDILERAALSEEVKGLKQADITHAVLSLRETGELAVVGRVRGENKGSNLYLPADMDVGRYKPSQPLTWLDEVAQTVDAMWAERSEEAKAAGLRPKPFTTGDVRARIADSPFHSRRELKKDPQALIDAVKHLSETREPLLRKIKRRGQKVLMWVPAGVADEDVDFGGLYANDAERMGAAVSRAAERLGRPVTIRDVKDEVEKDPAIQPVGDSSVFEALADAAKETYDLYNGKGPQKHALRRVYRIGRAGREAYYYPDDAPRAWAYVAFRRLEIRWLGIGAQEQLDALETASLAGVAKGRALLLTREVETLLRAASELLSEAGVDGATRHALEDLEKRAEETLQSGSRWLASRDSACPPVPDEVRTEVPVWTAAEFLEAVRPLYPLAQNIAGTNRFITLMDARVRRVPNPEFESRFSDNPRKAAEFFFDRADALLYAAKQWGGPECSLQSMLAGNELGRLRDHRFVFPALGSKNFETRLAGIACLAFLWSDEGNARLRRIAVEDSDAGVRQSALWAFGFAGGEGARELLGSRREEDPSPRVREFAREAIGSREGSWWRM